MPFSLSTTLGTPNPIAFVLLVINSFIRLLIAFNVVLPPSEALVSVDNCFTILSPSILPPTMEVPPISIPIIFSMFPPVFYFRNQFRFN